MVIGIPLVLLTQEMVSARQKERPHKESKLLRDERGDGL